MCARFGWFLPLNTDRRRYNRLLREELMGYPTARQNFESAKGKTDDPAIQEIADGLIQLSRAIESDFNKLERELSGIESKLR